MKQTSNADAGAVSQMQAFAEKVRNGIADYIADNMADRKHSLAEIDTYIRAIEINADRLAPTAPQADAAIAAGEARESVGTWLWSEFMGYCNERGMAPATADRLFLIVGRARNKFDASPLPRVAPTAQAAVPQDEREAFSCDEVKFAMQKVGMRFTKTNAVWLEKPIEHTTGEAMLSRLTAGCNELFKARAASTSANVAQGAEKLCTICNGYGRYQDGNSGTEADGYAPNIVECECTDEERRSEYRVVTTSAQTANVEQDKRIAMLEAQLINARDRLDRAVAILTRIHSFMTPEDVRLPDGRVFQFSNAEIEREMLRGLCKAIRGVPDEIANVAPAETVPKWVFDNLVKTLDPAWEYIQTHQDQFNARAGDDKNAILVEFFLRTVTYPQAAATVQSAEWAERWHTVAMQLAMRLGMNPALGADEMLAAAPAQSGEACAHDYVRSDRVCVECGEKSAVVLDDEPSTGICFFCGEPIDGKARAASPATATRKGGEDLTADDADMVWPDDDTETFFHTIDDAVENEISNAWPVNVEQPTNGELELKVQLAKRIPTATIRIFNITENGHEWEIVTDATRPQSTGEDAK